MTEMTSGENASTTSNRRSWRRWHGLIGLASAPFTLITAVCGGLLLIRKIGLYERRGAFRDTIQQLHSYEILLPYVGLVTVMLMILTAVTGVVLYCQTHRRR
jgi:uncharacterized iron-regulated membrane protein